MKYPQFFDSIESIELKDNLSAFLGTFEGGNVEFRYVDVVKSAGHSCPTVAGAFLMTREGLKALYGDQLPVRGEIFVSFKENSEEGVAGVIANVVTQITGATGALGFKGIGGHFVRHGLMEFEADITSSAKFKRLDTGQSVEVVYDPSDIEGHPSQQELMQKIMQGVASPEEKGSFGGIWQERVEKIFNNVDKVITINS